MLFVAISQDVTNHSVEQQKRQYTIWTRKDMCNKESPIGTGSLLEQDESVIEAWGCVCVCVSVTQLVRCCGSSCCPPVPMWHGARVWHALHGGRLLQELC